MGKIGMKRSLRSKLITMFIVFAVVLAVGVTVVGYFVMYYDHIELTNDRFRRVTEVIDDIMLDGDKLEQYYLTGETDADYDEMITELGLVKRVLEADYLFIFKPREDDFVFIADAFWPGDDTEAYMSLGDTFAYTEFEYEHLRDYVETADSPPDELLIMEETPEYSKRTKVWQPIFNSEGTLVAVLEMNIGVESVVRSVWSFMLPGAVSVALIIVGVAILTMISRRTITNPLAELTRSVSEFVQGDTLKYASTLKTGDEIQQLSEAFEKMTGDLESYTRRIAAVAASEDRMESELKLMRSISESVLPKPINSQKGYSVAGLTHPSQELGVGFYDYFNIDASKLGIVAAEMSSRGMSATLYAIVAKTMIKMELMRGLPVDETVNAINTEMYNAWLGKISASAFIGVLNRSTGLLNYVNADYSNPLHLRAGGPSEYLPHSMSQALAISRNVSYRLMESKLEEGDRLLLLSQDILNTTRDGQSFAESRLPALLDKLADSVKADDAAAEIMAGYDEYAQGEGGNITVLSVVYFGSGRSRVEITLQPKPESFYEVLPQIKKLLMENDLPGVFYAEFAVSLEELFTLCARRVSGRGSITLQCSVAAGTATVRLVFGGGAVNPLEPQDAREAAALDFIRGYGGELDYESAAGLNSVTLSRTAPESVGGGGEPMSNGAVVQSNGAGGAGALWNAPASRNPRRAELPIIDVSPIDIAGPIEDSPDPYSSDDAAADSEAAPGAADKADGD
ncbi:MAG: SpoIIE family protein phosphatase [Oscillospiraceae bacterium]|nr:SpoIIE family protein phosphatase [Oscillospiraceae bacterium]